MCGCNAETAPGIFISEFLRLRGPGLRQSRKSTLEVLAMPLDPRRVKELFNTALDLPEPADRVAFLDRECGGDPELRQRLDALMAAHDQPASALERPLAANLEGSPMGTPDE